LKDKVLTLQRREQKYRIVPSFFTCMIPVELGKFFPQKEHLNVFGVAYALPDLFRFSLGLSEHENIVEPDRTFHIPRDDPSFVAAF
jgi:hypothetical protein